MSWIPRAAELRRSIALRLTLFHALLFGLVSAGGGGLLYHLVGAHSLGAVDQDLVAQADELIRIHRREGTAGMRTEMETDTTARGTESFFTRLIDRQGRVILNSDLSNWTDLPLTPPPSGERMLISLDLPQSGRQARVLAMELDADHYLQLGVSLSDYLGFLELIRHNGYLILGSMLVVGGLGGFVLAHQAMAGVNAVTRSATRIADGHFAERVRTAGTGREIEELVIAFNRMADQVQRVMDEMRQVNDSIAHDLRSPLTRIRGLAETAVLHRVLSDEGAELAGNIVEECDRLMQLINTLLDIAEAEAGVQRLRIEELSAASLVSQVVELFSGLAEEKGIYLQAQPGAGQVLRGDRRRLQRALANLVDNAIKYTPAGGEVRVAAFQTGDLTLVEVADSGPGIPEAELPHIFERFYRGDRSRHLPGNGLGLALAQAVARSHGGSLRVQSGATGSQFTLSLPQSSLTPPAA